MSADCLFCKIGAKKIPSKFVYEDDEVFAFEDIGPQAPTHILICPRKHFASLDEAGPEDQALLGKLQLVAAQLARKLNLLQGYRTVVNNGSGASQSVFHPRGKPNGVETAVQRRGAEFIRANSNSPFDAQLVSYPPPPVFHKCSF